MSSNFPPSETGEINTLNKRENNFENKEPSIENPTREYLLKNFTKIQLQKHCRQMGISQIWVTKDKLADLIMRIHQSNLVDQASSTQDEDVTDPLEKIRLELQEIKKSMAQKDILIEELNDLLKNAHVTINRLNDRLTTLEEQVTNQPSPAAPVLCNKTLLLGDDNLREVRLSDLEENCSVKTVNDTTMDLLKCWVSEKLEWVPDKCIIYCGMNDLIENENLNEVLDDLGSLTSELKNKNENVELFVCELAPSLKEEMNARFSAFNDKLKDWCNVNGIKLVKTNLNFMLGTGEVDEMCFDVDSEKAGVSLNRCGVQRLLTVISKQNNGLKLSKYFRLGLQ